MFTGRTSVALLGYAALPWLLLVVPRRASAPALARRRAAGGGPRSSRSSSPRWAAASTGPSSAGCSSARCVLLRLRAARRRRCAGATPAASSLRMGVLGTLASLWWIVPLVLHVALRRGLPAVHRAAGDDLGDEQRRRGPAPDGATGRRTSGFGFPASTRPVLHRDGDDAVQPAGRRRDAAGPGLAVLGFIWTRRWRYGPFFLLILLAGMVDRDRGVPGRAPRPGPAWSGSTATSPC